MNTKNDVITKQLHFCNLFFKPTSCKIIFIIEIAYVKNKLLNLDWKKIGGKWKPLVLFILQTRPARFNKIKQLLPGISSNSLSRCLYEMERNGLIYRDTNMHASYHLTDNGNKICVMLIEIKKIVERLPDL